MVRFVWGKIGQKKTVECHLKGVRNPENCDCAIHMLLFNLAMELRNAGLGGKGLLSRYTANCSIKVLTKVQLSILGSVVTKVARENIWHKWHNVRLSHRIDACIIIHLCILYTSLSVNLWYVVAFTSTRSNHEAAAQMIPTPSNPSNLSHA